MWEHLRGFLKMTAYCNFQKIVFKLARVFFPIHNMSGVTTKQFSPRDQLEDPALPSPVFQEFGDNWSFHFFFQNFYKYSFSLCEQPPYMAIADWPTYRPTNSPTDRPTGLLRQNQVQWLVNTGDIAWHCASYYDAGKLFLILISQITCWQISTPFLCNIKTQFTGANLAKHKLKMMTMLKTIMYKTHTCCWFKWIHTTSCMKVVPIKGHLPLTVLFYLRLSSTEVFHRSSSSFKGDL